MKFSTTIPIHKSKNWLYLSNWINQPAVFLKKDLVSKVGNFNPKYNYAFDYEYWLRCSKIALPSHLKQTLAVFRVHSSSKGSSSYQKQFKEQQQIISNFTDNIYIKSLHKILNYFIVKSYQVLK